jgi:hypothetical protein
MKLFRIVFGLTLLSLIFTQCKKEVIDEPNLKRGALPDVVSAKTYTVTVENVSTPFDYFAAGAEFGVTGGDETPPAHPGETITVHFHAGPSHKLSFASMYGASNDWFYAPSDGGIMLFANDGTPLYSNVDADITSMIYLWDAGTEVDGSTMDEMESESVAMVPTAEENIQVLLAFDGTNNMFTLTIHVLPGSATPLSPVAWVVHSEGQKPIFTEGSLDYGMGLEDLAETGNAGPLSENLEMHSGYVSPIAPMLWVVHEKDDMPIFTKDTPDRWQGLKTLSETGNPGELYNSLMNDYNTGTAGTGPIFPGQMYSFSFDAKPNQYLSIASMLGNSNDEFFAFVDDGIKIAAGDDERDITERVMLWDAGTAVNQYPGTKTENVVEGGIVMMLNDGYPWPAASNVIKITIRKN